MLSVLPLNVGTTSNSDKLREGLTKPCNAHLYSVASGQGCHKSRVMVRGFQSAGMSPFLRIGGLSSPRASSVMGLLPS